MPTATRYSRAAATRRRAPARRRTASTCVSIRRRTVASCARRVPRWTDGGRQRVHLTHNFFVARTAALRRFGWDPRQTVMEHETFFYQLYLNAQPVLACPAAHALHNSSCDGDECSGDALAYEKRSLRNTKEPLQYLCKNLPEVKRFITPFSWWHCDTRELCGPHADAEFAHDGRMCSPLPWEAHDDASAVACAAPRHTTTPSASHRRPWRPVASRGAAARVGADASGHETRRAWQRETWLSFGWHERGSDALVPWRYAYFSLASSNASSSRGRAPRRRGAAAARQERLGPGARRARVGDAIHFESALIVDDTSLVHVGRVWEGCEALARRARGLAACGRRRRRAALRRCGARPRPRCRRDATGGGGQATIEVRGVADLAAAAGLRAPPRQGSPQAAAPTAEPADRTAVSGVSREPHAAMRCCCAPALTSPRGRTRRPSSAPTAPAASTRYSRSGRGSQPTF